MAYNPAKSSVYRQTLLEIYKEDLKELMKRKVPYGFFGNARRLKNAIPCFPKENQIEYSTAIGAGINQAKLIKSPNKNKKLKKKSWQRLKIIEDFLR